MSQDLSAAMAVSRTETWRPDRASPPVPGRVDATDLAMAVGHPPEHGCALVRVRLASPATAVRERVREWLRAEETVVGTSIGRDLGPGARDTFDIAVEPGYDLDAVGRALGEVDEVVGVSAAAFEASEGSADRSGGRRDSSADRVPPAERDSPRAGTDERFEALRSQVATLPYEALVAELDGRSMGGDGTDLAPLLESDEAVEDGRHAAGEPTDVPDATDGAATNRRSATDQDLVDRLDALEVRLAALETRLDDSQARPPGDDRDDGPARGHRATERTSRYAKRPVDDGAVPAAAGEVEALEERFEALAATVEELAAWQQRLRTALIGETG